MIQALQNSYPNPSKTDEIMARYRPIAPKPDAAGSGNSINNDVDPSLTQNIRNSPYLMNVWPQLQARPTRTRKRGRASALPPPSPPSPAEAAAAVNRARTLIHGVAPSFQVTASPAKTLALQGFVHSYNVLPQIPMIPNLVPLKSGLNTPVTTPSNYVTLPLLPCTPFNGMETLKGKDQAVPIIDLNKVADAPVELDFMRKLEAPNCLPRPRVITPRAVRPLGSTIVIGHINEYSAGGSKQVLNMLAEEVEKEAESYEFPIIVSDFNNNVRFENAAYKDLVGQPMCSWLDCMLDYGGGGGGGAPKRIGGEVLLKFVESQMPILSNGFTCRVKIEWACNGVNRSVNAFCEAKRVFCNKNYVFEWRFHLMNQASV